MEISKVSDVFLALEAGKKVTHKNWSDDEYMMLQDNELVAEDSEVITTEVIYDILHNAKSFSEYHTTYSYSDMLDKLFNAPPGKMQARQQHWASDAYSKALGEKYLLMDTTGTICNSDGSTHAIKKENFNTRWIVDEVE